MNSGYTEKKPRLWPSLVIALITLPVIGLVATLTINIIVGQSSDPGIQITDEIINLWMQQNMTTAKGFLSILIPIHLAMLIIALVAARFSRTPIKQRLGLVRGLLPLWQYPIVMFGAVGASALAGWLFLAHIAPGEDEMAMALAFTQTTGWNGAIIALYAAIVASFTEELLFRGFVLRGLLRRLNPFIAIVMVAVLFSLTHPSPFFMAAAFLPGVWFGIVLWRTQSVWPALACHSFGNIALALLNRWYPEPTVAFFGELTLLPIAVGIFGVVMMGVSIKLLFRK
ncbi:MAG: CPBP family intramembrane metalloprotease [FCB group bacterium]|nr:CPBP family intramembrane metalloprotease [FCB group bacterium]